MKLYTREQNLVTDISDLKYFFHVTSEDGQTAHFFGMVTIYKPRLPERNNHVIYWDLEEKINFLWQQEKYFLVCKTDMGHLTKSVTSSIKIFCQEGVSFNFIPCVKLYGEVYDPQAAVDIMRTKLPERLRWFYLQNENYTTYLFSEQQIFLLWTVCKRTCFSFEHLTYFADVNKPS